MACGKRQVKAGVSDKVEMRRVPGAGGSGAGSAHPRQGRCPQWMPCRRHLDNRGSKISHDTRFMFNRMGANPRAGLAVMSRAVAIVITLLFSNSVSADPQTLTIVYPPEKNAFHDAAAAIILEAYKRLNIEIVFKTLPAERALQSSNSVTPLITVDTVISEVFVREATLSEPVTYPNTAPPLCESRRWLQGHPEVKLA